MEVLKTAVSLLVALSILIAVHEFGHYWVARRLGVKVLRFSIGFGKPLWSVRRGADQTEYMISAIPLGGYVKMLDEREGEVAAEDLPRAFNRQKVWKRFAIVSAGPLFNLAFAVAALTLVLLAGVPGLKPIVGEVEPGTVAAQAGLQPGSEILEINGEVTATLEQVFEKLLPAALNQEPVEMTVAYDGRRQTLRLPLDRLDPAGNPDDLVETIGIQPRLKPTPAVVQSVEEGSPAARAGLQAEDRVLAVNGVAVRDWTAMTRQVRAHPGESVQLEVERGGERLMLQVIPEKVETPRGPIGRIGAGGAISIDPDLIVETEFGPGEALVRATERTWDVSVLILQTMGKVVTGNASLKNISGPITIGQYAKSAAEAGVQAFFGLLAAVSISLGVLNLLPIPVLDGGHLMFYLVEMVKGSPVSEKTEIVAQKVGITLLLMLMMVAFYNDFARLAS